MRPGRLRDALSRTDSEGLAGSGEIAIYLLTGVLAGSFYLAPWPPLYVPLLLAMSALLWFRPRLTLVVVPLFAPFFMNPKHIGRYEFAPAEIFLLVGLALLGARVMVARTVALVDFGRARSTRLLAPMLLLVVAAAVSTVAAADHHQAIQSFRLRILEPAAFFVLVTVLLRGRKDWWLLGAALVAAGFASCLIAIGQLLSHQELTYAVGSSIPHVKALYGSPDNLGLLLDRSIPAWFAGLWFFRRPGRRTALWFSGGAVLTVILFFTQSRGAWLGCSSGCLLIVALLERRGKWILLALTLLAAGGVAVKGQTVAHALGGGHSNTVERRLDIWRSSVHMLRDHPLTGIGPDNFLHYYAPRQGQQLYSNGCRGLGYLRPSASDEPCLSHPHNVVLDFWLSTGLLGLVAFAWLLVTFSRGLQMAWRNRGRDEDRYLLAGAAGVMLASLVHGLVDNFYFLPDLAIMFWLTLGFTAAMQRWNQ